MRKKGYYNTNNLTGVNLRRAIKNGVKTNEIIMLFFKGNRNKSFTPFEVWRFLFRCSVPITSVRRSLTDLTNDNKLMKTGVMRDGEYGKPNHCWKLKYNQ